MKRTTAVGLVSLALAFAAPLVAMAGPAEDCNQYQDLDRRIRGCTDFLATNPNAKNSAIAYAYRGTAHVEKGDLERAIADLEQALVLDPQYAYARAMRGYAHAQKREYDRAIADFTRAIDIQPTYWWAVLQRGFARHNKREYELAVADYTTALSDTDAGTRSDARFNRFNALVQLKRYPAAHDDLLALARDHTQLLAKVEARDVWKILEQLEEQQRYADTVTLLQALSRANYRGHDKLGFYRAFERALIAPLVKLNRVAEAAQYASGLNLYGQLLELRIDRTYAALWSHSGAQIVSQPREALARELAATQALVRAHPRSLAAVYYLSQALQHVGRYAESVTVAQAALDNPSAFDKDAAYDAWLRNQVADALTAQGKFEESNNVLRPLLALDPKQHSFVVSQFINLGAQLFWQGKFEEAMRTAERAKGRSSVFGEMLIQSVAVCSNVKLGRMTDAQGTMLDMLKTQDENQSAVLRSALCLGHEDQAAAILIKMLRTPKMRADILARLQNCVENPQRPALSREYRVALLKVRDRPEVRKVVDELGVIADEPVRCGDRYGTR